MIETDLSEEEFMKAFRYLKRNKTPGFDEGHANVIKCTVFCKKKLGKNEQVQKLLKILRTFLEPEFHPASKKSLLQDQESCSIFSFVKL